MSEGQQIEDREDDSQLTVADIMLPRQSLAERIESDSRMWQSGFTDGHRAGRESVIAEGARRILAAVDSLDDSGADDCAWRRGGDDLEMRLHDAIVSYRRDNPEMAEASVIPLELPAYLAAWVIENEAVSR